MAQIHEAMIAIMRDIQAIGKDQRNQQQGFSFRGIDDVMNSLHDIFSTHGVVVKPRVLDHRTEERQTKSGGIMTGHILRVEFVFTAADGSSDSAIMDGESADSGDKGTSKAVSIALKYALTQTFLIPTSDEKDPDYTSHQLDKRTKRYTKEQQAVVDEKLKTAPAPATTSKNFDVLSYFADMKKKLGEKEYYRILGNNGFEKSNHITDIKEQRRIYGQMMERAKEIDLERDGGLPQQ